MGETLENNGIGIEEVMLEDQGGGNGIEDEKLEITGEEGNGMQKILVNQVKGNRRRMKWNR